MKVLYALLPFALAGMLSAATLVPEPQSAGQDLKDAGKKTTSAVKKGTTKSTSAVKDGTTKSTKAVKKGAHKAAEGTEKGADKVKDKTTDTTSH
jgi:hypothetical protein